MILTNKMKVSYNMKNIDEDFDVFQVVKENKDYYKINILDSALYEFKAAAVQYTFGATALVLFRKGETTEQSFRENIMKEYKDVRIQKIDILDDEQCQKCFYYENRLLAQLLLNSMGTPKDRDFMYNNLTGKLFYHDSSWRYHKEKSDFIWFLQIVLEPGMYLNLDNKTFKKQDYIKGKSLYIFDSKTGQFRKKLKTDKAEDTYVEGSSPNHHFTVKNFNIRSYENFQKTKMGVMRQFLCDVKDKLDKYITLEVGERNDVQTFEIPKWQKKGIKKKEYGELLNKRGVVIVDENHSKKSKDLITQLKKELSESYNVNAKIGELSKTAYNIRIIHDSDYYYDNELPDPHGDNLEEYIVQHMTEEVDYSKNNDISHAIKKVIQDLLVKGDIKDRIISIYDWNRLNSKKAWSFVIRKKIEENLNNNTKNNYYDYYRLKIDQMGNITFDVFRDFNEIGNEEWEKICYTYDEIERKHQRIRNKVEGLLYSDINNIHAIILTKEKTIPNIFTIGDDLKKTDIDNTVAKEKLLEGIADFEKKYPEYKKEVLEWYEKLKDAASTLKNKEIKKILNMRKDVSSYLNRFLHENYNIWVFAEMRNEDFEAIYQISNLVDIKYQYDDSDYTDGCSFVYYVGYKSKRESYPTSCCIRKIVNLDSNNKLEYEELLPLMAVDFVRNSQYTVVPFPYKYLRERTAQQ